MMDAIGQDAAEKLSPWERAGKAAWNWWSSLQPRPNAGHRGDRAAQAQLRRCSTMNEALLIPAFWELRNNLAWYADSGGQSEQRIAALAIILAHIRENDRVLKPRHPDHRSHGDPDRILLSEIRFRRLMQARSADELRAEFVRYIHLLKGQANVTECAKTVLFWGDHVRRDWAFHYFAAGAGAPDRTAAQDQSVGETAL